MRAHVFAHMTGERITAESAEFGDAAERGWVDPSWSRTVFHESRNDVRPIVSEDLDSEDLADYVREAIEELGAYEDNGDGTFYAADSDSDYVTGDEFRYALHFTLKYRTNRSVPGMPKVPLFEERGWHPSEAGIALP
jgi:hypothetical protein